MQILSSKSQNIFFLSFERLSPLKYLQCNGDYRLKKFDLNPSVGLPCSAFRLIFAKVAWSHVACTMCNRAMLNPINLPWSISMVRWIRIFFSNGKCQHTTCVYGTVIRKRQNVEKLSFMCNVTIWPCGPGLCELGCLCWGWRSDMVKWTGSMRWYQAAR